MPKAKKAVPKKGKPAKPARDPMNEASHKITLLRVAERTLEKALSSGDPVKIGNAERAVVNAKRKAQQAVAASSAYLSSMSTRPTPDPNRQPRPDPATRVSEPSRSPDTPRAFDEDPDASDRSVWIFRTGSTFHRRDCQVVEAKPGAVRVPLRQAKAGGLERCRHCVPSVR